LDVHKPPAALSCGRGALLRDDPALDPGIFGSTIPSSTNPVSGLEYRDAWPDYVFRYVLVHEIGHYFGLDHPGHTGANHIMWSLASRIPAVSWETVGEAFLSAEPRFIDDDACTVWRWILTNGQTCITLPNSGPTASALRLPQQVVRSTPPVGRAPPGLPGVQGPRRESGGVPR
jgi:hypothetical protein